MDIKEATLSRLRMYQPYLNMDDPVRAGKQFWEDTKKNKVDGYIPFSLGDISRAMQDQKDTYEGAIRGKSINKIDRLENIFDYQPSFKFDLNPYESEISKALSQIIPNDKNNYKSVLKNVADILNEAYFIEFFKGLTKRIDTTDFRGYAPRMQKQASNVVLIYLRSI